jgi:hypothetical protein
MALLNLLYPERPIYSRDKLSLYLAKPLIDLLGITEYWKVQESEWPHLTRIVYDFLSISAISSKYKRVFSSYIKITSPKSSRLSGKSL